MVKMISVMKRSLLIILSLSFALIGLQAQTGKVMDNLSMKSKILGMDRKYAVYLPPDYETSQRSYPVLYLLHGAGDDQSGWVQFGEVLHIADQAINSGQATPMIIVMPDANTGKRGYVNDMKNEWSMRIFSLRSLCRLLKRVTVSGPKKDTGLLPVFRWAAKVHSYMPFITPNSSHRPARSAPPPDPRTLKPLRITDFGVWPLKPLSSRWKNISGNTASFI